MTNYPPEILKALEQFYNALDSQIHSIEQKNRSRINCKKGCFSCCKDDLEVFGIEAKNIQNQFTDLLQNETEAPKGGCAFLDTKGACRIYNVRPFICRTHGVPIAFLEEDAEGIYELRDICPLNEEGEPLEELSDDSVFQNNAWEEKLAELQLIADKGKLDRFLLRDLFKK